MRRGTPPRECEGTRKRMVLLDEVKRSLSELQPEVADLADALAIERSRLRLEELENKSADPAFYDDAANSGKVFAEMGEIKERLENYRQLQELCSDAETLLEMCAEDETDEAMAEEARQTVDTLAEKVEQMRLVTLLTGEYDANNAILTFHAGAGGTEAQDWAQMLQRMYLRWADSHGFSVEELDFLPGDEAGIKSVSLRISGENVYGFLKGERGIHRLIRISPFDSSGRRHTSFASVDVIPDAGDDIEIEIKESDLRVDIFCASGPGGQGVNTTYSAVRITHIPSGISVQCQNERSQHHNKDSAMRILRGRLYDLELSKRDAARQAEYAGKNAISFGSQIRTYTLQPYRLVKDHRNNCEIGDTDAVLDGRIDKLLRDYLLWQHTNRQQQQQ